jgi:hypothetical protein
MIATRMSRKSGTRWHRPPAGDSWCVAQVSELRHGSQRRTAPPGQRRRDGGRGSVASAPGRASPVRRGEGEPERAQWRERPAQEPALIADGTRPVPVPRFFAALRYLGQTSVVEITTSRRGSTPAHALSTCIVPTSSSSCAHSDAWVGCDRYAPWTNVSIELRWSRVASSPSIVGCRRKTSCRLVRVGCERTRPDDDRSTVTSRVVFQEPRQELGHELAEDVTVVAAEVVEAMIDDGDADATAQPAVGGVELDEPRDLATRADAVTGGIDPEPRRSLGSVAGAPAISPRARTSASSPRRSSLSSCVLPARGQFSDSSWPCVASRA